MPDGDIVHSQLRLLYQKPYKWLCERKATSDECAQVAIAAVKKDIIEKGNLPVILAQNMQEILVHARSENGSVDYAALSLEFDRLAQQTNGQPYLKELTLRAGKSVLHELRYGQTLDINKASAVILKRYMSGVYESEFKERVPLTLEHHAGIEQVTLNQRIKDIEPAIFAATDQWANQANANSGVEKLRLPRRPQVNEIDLDEDLLAG